MRKVDISGMKPGHMLHLMSKDNLIQAYVYITETGTEYGPVGFTFIGYAMDGMDDVSWTELPYKAGARQLKEKYDVMPCPENHGTVSVPSALYRTIFSSGNVSQYGDILQYIEAVNGYRKPFTHEDMLNATDMILMPGVPVYMAFMRNNAPAKMMFFPDGHVMEDGTPSGRTFIWMPGPKEYGWVTHEDACYWRLLTDEPGRMRVSRVEIGPKEWPDGLYDFISGQADMLTHKADLLKEKSDRYTAKAEKMRVMASLYPAACHAERTENKGMRQ